jgi:hypothetical protein
MERVMETVEVPDTVWAAISAHATESPLAAAGLLIGKRVAAAAVVTRAVPCTHGRISRAALASAERTIDGSELEVIGAYETRPLALPLNALSVVMDVTVRNGRAGIADVWWVHDDVRTPVDWNLSDFRGER